MDKVFIYSKRFSDQESKVTEFDVDARISISRLSIVNSTTTYNTTSTSLKTVAKTIERKLRLNNTLSKMYYSGGLLTYQLENGDTELSLDGNWLGTNYVSSENWPFTQVGDPTESAIPVGVNHNSVSYPYVDEHMCRPFPMFVEGTGDLRILKPVSNGKEVQYTYSVWKKYRYTTATNLVHRDLVYQPTGILSTEVISHIFTTSSTAMVMEISTRNANGGLTFKEYAVAILNGTLSASKHAIVRLGRLPVDLFYGTSANLSTAVSTFRKSNLTAVVNGSTIILGYMPSTTQVTIAGAAGAIRYLVARLTYSGTSVTASSLDTGWVGVNEYAEVNTGANSGIWLSSLYSINPSTRNSLFVAGDATAAAEITVSGVNDASGVDVKWSWSDIVDGEIIAALLYRFEIKIKGDVKVKGYATKYMRLNLSSKRATAASDEVLSPRQLYSISGAVSTMNTVGGIVPYTPSTLKDGAVIDFQILQYGDRIFTETHSSPSIYSVIKKMDYSATIPVNSVQGMSDNYFITTAFEVGSMISPQMTPLKPNELGLILHDRLVTLGVTSDSAWNISQDPQSPETTTVLSPTLDSSYTVLDNVNSGIVSTIQGHSRSGNTSIVSSNRVIPAINSFATGSTVRYHNAIWSSVDTAFADRYYDITANLTATKKYSALFSLRSKINQVVNTIPLSGGNSDAVSTVWWMTPIYPGISNDFAILEVQRFEKVRVSGVLAETGVVVYYRAIVPITQTADGLGNYTITDITISAANFTVQNVASNVISMATGTNYMQHNATAIKLNTDGTVSTLTRNGVSYTTTSATVNNHHPTFVSYAVSGKVQTVRYRVATNAYPVIDITTKKLGFVCSAGAGAYYAFRGVDATTGAVEAISTIYGTISPNTKFNVNIPSTLTVYLQGKEYLIKPTYIDLTTVTSTPENKDFYLYIEISHGVAKVVPSLTKIDEHLHRIYLTKITTNATTVNTFSIKPLTRWDIARPSLDPIGGAIAISTGHPSDTDSVTTWLDTAYVQGTPGEYLWGSKDIVDVDDVNLLDSYFALDSNGLFPASGSVCMGHSFYLIVKVRGAVASVRARVTTPGLPAGSLLAGSPEGHPIINIPMTYDASSGVSFGSYRFMTSSTIPDDNAVYDYVDVATPYNTDIVNPYPYTIWVVMRVGVTDPEGSFNESTTAANVYVDGVLMGGFFTHKWSGSIGAEMTGTFPVPAGKAYRVNTYNGVRFITSKWYIDKRDIA